MVTVLVAVPLPTANISRNAALTVCSSRLWMVLDEVVAIGPGKRWFRWGLAAVGSSRLAIAV
jgi:hypothetical protein